MKAARSFDPVVVYGTLVGVGVAVPLALFADPVLLLAFCVTLLAAVISIQITLVERVDRRTKRDDTEAQFISHVRDVPWLFPVVEKLARSAAAIEESARRGPTVFSDVAKQRLNEVESVMQELVRGQLRVPVEDTGLLFEQFETVGKTLQAVSIDALDSTWRWSTNARQKYWERNKLALGRGVTIERIFVYRQLTAELADVINEQTEAGVEVYLVHVDDVRPELRNDVAIWDGRFVSETSLNTDGVPILNVYWGNKVDVDRRKREFLMVRECAQPAPKGALKSRPELVASLSSDEDVAADGTEPR